jgi:hypothetical protein
MLEPGAGDSERRVLEESLVYCTEAEQELSTMFSLLSVLCSKTLGPHAAVLAEAARFARRTEGGLSCFDDNAVPDPFFADVLGTAVLGSMHMKCPSSVGFRARRGRWCTRTLTNFAYRFLQFHVHLQEECTTSIVVARCHCRIKLPAMLGGFETQWREYLSLPIDSETLQIKNQDKLLSATLCRNITSSGNEGEVEGEGGSEAVCFILWYFNREEVYTDSSDSS